MLWSQSHWQLSSLIHVRICVHSVTCRRYLTRKHRRCRAQTMTASSPLVAYANWHCFQLTIPVMVTNWHFIYRQFVKRSTPDFPVKCIIKIVDFCEYKVFQKNCTKFNDAELTAVSHRVTRFSAPQCSEII